MNHKKSKIINRICDGVFTHRIKFYKYKNYKNICKDLWLYIDDKLIDNIKLFYSHLQLNNFQYSFVYRAIRIPRSKFSTCFPHPLPFSTSTCLEFVKEWLTYCNATDYLYIIFKIKLNNELLLLPHERDDYEKEITLSPGNIIIKDIKIIDNIYYCDSIYIPYNKSKYISILNNLNNK